MPQELRKEKYGLPVQKDRLRDFLVALGGNLPSNIGEPIATIGKAMETMAESGLQITARSQLYRTPCFPAGAGPDFVNAAVAVRTAMSPVEVLAILADIELAFGRERKDRWQARSLDLDLLAAGSTVLPDVATFRAWQTLDSAEQQRRAPDQLILPHPRLHERAFVLVPLAEVAPHWRHPVIGKTVADMLAALPETEKSGITVIQPRKLSESRLSSPLKAPK